MEPAVLSINPEVTIKVRTSVYPRAALFRACYFFTDRCWIWLTPSNEEEIDVHLVRKNSTDDLKILQGEFANALIDHAVRYQVNAETKDIRAAIVSAALVEARHE